MTGKLWRILSYTLLVVVVVVAPSSVIAAPLTSQSVQLSSPEASAANVSYNFGLTTATNGQVGSLKLQFCSNYQFDPTDICQPPSGFNASGATLGQQTGIADFSISLRTANRIILSRPLASALIPQPVSFQLQGIVNPADLGSDYVWLQTYADTAASGNVTDDGQLVFAINKSISITTQVPPYLLFCSGVTIAGYDCSSAEGNFLSFGELSSRSARLATSQLLASTNAESGYSVTLSGATMTAGNSVIPALANPTASQPGSNQFGLNVRANTSPSGGSDPTGPGIANVSARYNQPNRFSFGNGDILASAPTGDDYRKLTLSYLVNIRSDQAPGNYVATINYICLANF